MALLDRPRLARLAEMAEERIGITIRPTTEVRRLQELEQEFSVFRDEAEELALHSLDYFGGRPSEMRHERRRRIAQRARIALMWDPLAGAEAQLLADFAFGSGIGVPTARDPKVQDVIDEAWSDANNEEKLTSFAAQRKLSNELLTAGELFVTFYESAGKIRVGRLDPDTVISIVTDPEDRLRPLWYVAAVRRFEWDFENDQPKIVDVLEDGRSKVRYWKHWRNYDDAVRERELGVVEDNEEPLETPPTSKMAKGVVYHVAINQTGEQLRGNPPWARSLRFFTAMNVLTEAHVTMAQGASTFVARRVMKASPNQITRAATSLMGAVSELGSAARHHRGWGGENEPATQGFAPGSPPPVPPGSWWNENESSKLEALNLNSGASQMATTAQIVRAPIAAASGFGQHYLGDASNANLATATTLELPATMRIGGWQQSFKDLFGWFTDRAVEAAVKAGRLGGGEGFFGERPLAELRLHEAEDRAAMEHRTEKDLSYEFSMPYPGRRNLPDVVGLVAQVSTAMDPNGVNVPLRKQLLRFLFTQMGLEDPARAVEEAIPEKGIPGGIGPATTTGTFQGGGAPAPAGATEPGANPDQLPYGAKTQGTPAEQVNQEPGKPAQEAEWIPPDLRGAVAGLEGDLDKLWQQLVIDPSMIATLQLAAANGASAS